MSEQSETMSVADVMSELKMSRMTVHRRVKEGRLTPINTSEFLYRQHKLFFLRRDVERLKHGRNSDEGKPAA